METWIWYYLKTRKFCAYTVKLVKNANIDKCRYSRYDIGFDRHVNFSVATGFGKKVILSGADMSSWM